MKTTLKVFGIIICAICGFLLYVQWSYKKKFDRQITGIKATTDSTVIARGKYLVLGPAHCYTCHIPDSAKHEENREAMIGGKAFITPFATFFTPNITSDKETGIGAFSDEELAGAIRYNLNHSNRAMVGFMSYNNMTDDDISAVISYLRTTPPIRNVVPRHDYNIIGKILMRFLIKPVVPSVPQVKPDTTAEYGKYLAYNVMNCNGCHTNRNSVGEFIGEPFAGGHSWELQDATYTSANLTHDDSTGRISHWNQDIFIQRFRVGRVLEHSPMPWDAYRSMSDFDLTALYKFLHQLPPVHNEVITYSPKAKGLENIGQR